ALSEKGGQTRVADAMLTDIPSLSERHRIDDSLRLLEQGAPAIAVTDAAGRLVGLVTWENLIERLMIDQAREKRARGSAGPWRAARAPDAEASR
ncbi:MAG: CBS domain-containing protein, partial [Allosphingosinicella sp.]